VQPISRVLVARVTNLTPPGSGVTTLRVGRLDLVDLAGSERLKKSESEVGGCTS
jgi:hypothetical protein